jgi:hypothetical protein
MSTISLNLPTQAHWIGALHDKQKLHNLDHDMLSVELPGEIFIDVGWHPNWDSNGQYRISVYQKDIDNKLETTAYSRDPAHVKNLVEELARSYTPSIQISASSVTSARKTFGKRMVSVITATAASFLCAYRVVR